MEGEDTIQQSKPFKYAYEKEIVMHAFIPFFFYLVLCIPTTTDAYIKKLDYFSTECIYLPDT